MKTRNPNHWTIGIEVPLRFELRALDSKSRVFTVTLRSHYDYNIIRVICVLAGLQTNMFVYTLLLERNEHGQDCFYVGTAANVNERFEAHLKGCVAWTRLHSPVQVLSSELYADSLSANLAEDSLTIRLMIDHGVECVRGGSYAALDVSDRGLDVTLAHAKGVCYTCGEGGHYAKECWANICARCGRDSHTEEDCFAKRHVQGQLTRD